MAGTRAEDPAVDSAGRRPYDIVEMLNGGTLVKVSAPMVRYSK